MHFELNVGGLTVVKGELAPVFLDLFRGSTPPPTMPTMSAPMTVPQVRELFASIDAKSVLFLKKLAANGGAMTWGEARAIFGIADTKDSSAYGFVLRPRHHACRPPNFAGQAGPVGLVA